MSFNLKDGTVVIEDGIEYIVDCGELVQKGVYDARCVERRNTFLKSEAVDIAAKLERVIKDSIDCPKHTPIFNRLDGIHYIAKTFVDLLEEFSAGNKVSAKYMLRNYYNTNVNVDDIVPIDHQSDGYSKYRKLKIGEVFAKFLSRDNYHTYDMDEE